MKTYLELEGELGNQTCTNIFSPDTISSPQKILGPKKGEQKKKIGKAPVKRRFKVRVITQPMPINPTLPMSQTLSTDPTPTAVTTMVTLTQMPVARSVTAIAKSISVTVYNLAPGKFKEIPYPVSKSQEEESPSTSSGNNPLLEAAMQSCSHHHSHTEWRGHPMAKYQASLW